MFSIASSNVAIGNATTTRHYFNVSNTDVTLARADGNATTLKVGTVSANGGSASAPSYAFVSDSDTGVYSPSGNIVSVAAGATEQARFHYANMTTLRHITVNSTLTADNAFYGNTTAYAAQRFANITAGPAVFNGDGSKYVSGGGLRLSGQDLTATPAAGAVIELEGGRAPLGSAQGSEIRFYTSGSQRAVIDKDGYFQLGTSSTLSENSGLLVRTNAFDRFRVMGDVDGTKGNTVIRFGSSEATFQAASPNNTLFMYMKDVSASPRLGIGTYAPDATLHVQGNVKVANVINFGSNPAGSNNYICLWGDTYDPNSYTHYGFGVNSYTLRYQTTASDNMHKFYGGSTLFATIASTSSFAGPVGISGALNFGNRLGNCFITLWGDSYDPDPNITNDSGVYGFGINGSTLRYQCSYPASHRFYCGAANVGVLGISGAVFSGPLSCNGGIFHLSSGGVNAQGWWIQWNRGGGDGATYYMNQMGLGYGGHIFGEATTSDVFSETMRISASGDLTVTDKIFFGYNAGSGTPWRYSRMSWTGGNSQGFIFGSYNLVDAVNMSFNYYHDHYLNTGYIPNTSYSTSRITLGFGYVNLYAGANNTAPTALALQAAQTAGVGIVGINQTADPSYNLKVNGSAYVTNHFRTSTFYNANDTAVLWDQGQLALRYPLPTVVLRCTNNYSAFVHCGYGNFYILRGATDTGYGEWSTYNGYWPAYWNLGNNACTMGGNLYVADGRLGVNTVSPSFSIHCVGSCYISGNFVTDYFRPQVNTWHQSWGDNVNRFYFGSAGTTYFGTWSGYVWRSSADADMMVLDSGSNVGIGTGSPNYRLHVSGGQAYIYGAANTNNYLKLECPTAGYQTAIELIKAGSSKWILYNPGNSNNFVFYSSPEGADRHVFYSNGDLTIGGANAWKVGGGSWAASSDARIKKNVETANLALCHKIIKSLPLQSFDYADEYLEKNPGLKDRHQLGWIAQDVEKVLPKSVHTSEEDVFGYPADFRLKLLDVDQILKVAVGALQHLIVRVDALEKNTPAMS